MLKNVLVGGPSNDALYTCKPFNGKELLIAGTYHQVHGVWKEVESSTATTTVIAEPAPDGYLVITYLFVSSEKDNLGVITLQLTDGTNTETFFTRNLANEPLLAEIDFSNSRVAGWKDARLEMVTSGASFNANSFVAYTKLPEGLEFSDWNAMR